MELLEYFEENRKKVIPILNIVKKVKYHEIGFYEFRLKLSTILSKMIGMTIPVTIIDDRYPQIFINCKLENFKIISKGLYISESLFERFLPEELVAAILHETGHFYRIKKNPDLIKWFYRSRRMGYIYSISGTILTSIIAIIKKYADYKNDEKIRSKSTRYLIYITLILLLSTIVLVSFNAYYFHKVGNEEYVADSFANKFGYGKELISFMEKYEELEKMYGYKSLSKFIETLSNFTRNVMKIIGLHPHDGKRFCQICYDIIQKADQKNRFDMDLYNWAKEQYDTHCRKHKPVDNSDILKAKKVLSIIKWKLKGK